MSNEKLLDHEADGIKEYDNDLPKWWVYLFIGTIIWSGIYIIYFHFSGNKLPVDSLAEQMALSEQKKAETTANTPLDLNSIIADQNRITQGQALFLAKCAACHGPEGAGLVGPNLTDNFWIHGGSPEAILNTINKGVPAKGMLAWENLMTKEEILSSLAFIHSLKGKNLPGKPAEGSAE